MPCCFRRKIINHGGKRKVWRYKTYDDDFKTVEKSFCFSLRFDPTQKYRKVSLWHHFKISWVHCALWKTMLLVPAQEDSLWPWHIYLKPRSMWVCLFRFGPGHVSVTERYGLTFHGMFQNRIQLKLQKQNSCIWMENGAENLKHWDPSHKRVTFCKI